jgi:hypothetical protein
VASTAAAGCCLYQGHEPGGPAYKQVHGELVDYEYNMVMSAFAGCNCLLEIVSMDSLMPNRVLN